MAKIGRPMKKLTMAFTPLPVSVRRCGCLSGRSRAARWSVGATRLSLAVGGPAGESAAGAAQANEGTVQGIGGFRGLEFANELVERKFLGLDDLSWPHELRPFHNHLLPGLKARFERRADPRRRRGA